MWPRCGSAKIYLEYTYKYSMSAEILSVCLPRLYLGKTYSKYLCYSCMTYMSLIFCLLIKVGTVRIFLLWKYTTEIQ